MVYNLCRQLERRGFRNRVVTANRLFREPGRILPAEEVIDGIEVVRVPFSGSSRYPLMPGIFGHVADADLIHVHAVDFAFDALSWGRLLHRRPMVATTHGGFFHTQNYAAIKQVWFRTITRISASGYRQLVCCSQSDSEQFRQIAPTRTVTIENGADIGKYAGRSSPVPGRRIVTIGRFSVNKRLENLIAAMVPLAATGEDWHLDIIGVNSDLTADGLAALAAKAGVSDRVRVHLALPNEEVARLLDRASIMASASEYEGFGLVAVEAMSAGLAPVLEGNDAYRKLAARHPDLLITDFTRPETAAAAIRACHQRLETDGEAIRQRLMREAGAYSWEAVADHYVDAYRRAVPSLGARLPLPVER